MSTTPRFPPYKVTKPVPPHKVAKPTPRTHEENQERAYIAASRRSDRSLEARMESAKRASEIHKKRTGRYYRITEETVVNEQMYEEEDDTPRYRLAASLQLPNSVLQGRVEAMMSVQMESRRLLGEAVSSTLQHNAQLGNQAQFVSPGMMSMPHYQYPMASPQIFNQSPQTPTFHQSPSTPMSYVQSPYSTSNDNMRQSYHQRSASIAAVPQYRPSVVDTSQEEHGRRMSMPPQNPPQMSNSAREAAESAVESSESSPTTPKVSRTIPEVPPLPHKYHNTPISQMGPLTTELPRETRQLLDSGIWPNVDSSAFDRMMQNPSDQMYQQPLLYNYRPNSSKGNNASVGLDQTLSSTPPDANLNATSNEPSYEYGFDDNTTLFNFDNMGSFNDFNSAMNSGQQTPADEWTNFLDNDMFGTA